MTFKNIETSRPSFCSYSPAGVAILAYILKVMSGGTFQIFQDISVKEWYVLVLPFLLLLLDSSTIQSKHCWRLSRNNYDLSGHNAPCRGFRIPVTDSSVCEWNLDSGFSSSVAGIPDSLSCIPDFEAHDSGFHIQKLPGFRNPHSLTWGELIVFYIVL